MAEQVQAGKGLVTTIWIMECNIKELEMEGTPPQQVIGILFFIVVCLVLFILHKTFPPKLGNKDESANLRSDDWDFK